MAFNKTTTIRNMRASVCRKGMAAASRRYRLRMVSSERAEEEKADDAKPKRTIRYATRPGPHQAKKKD